MTRAIVLVAAIAIWALVTHPAAQGTNPLVGAWERIYQSRTDGTLVSPSEAFLIFSPSGHFSQTTLPPGRPKSSNRVIPGDGQPTKPLQEMTREELLARFQGVEARLGTYTINGTKLTRIHVATLQPEEEGFELVQEFRIEGDILTLISTAPNSKAVTRFRRLR